MRSDRLLAQLHDKVAGVVAFIGTKRDRLRAVGMRFNQRQRRQALGMARSAGRYGTDDQAVAVLYQRVTDEIQPRLLARPFTVETGVGVGGRGVRVVGAALAVKVALAIATGSRRLARAVFGAKALRARPGLQQRAVDREV